MEPNRSVRLRNLQLPARKFNDSRSDWDAGESIEGSNIRTEVFVDSQSRVVASFQRRTRLVKGGLSDAVVFGIAEGVNAVHTQFKHL